MLASAAVIATPALGPSFGIAPAGTCTWRSKCLKADSGMPRSSACARTHECAAWADSRITSPSLPVIVIRPDPRERLASINKMSPPTGVHARPVATPGTSVRSATSL